jgi:hypothetical protein
MISSAVAGLDRGSPPQARAAPDEAGNEAADAVDEEAAGAGDNETAGETADAAGVGALVAGNAVGCGGVIKGYGRTGVAAACAGRSSACSARPGGSPIAAAAMAAQQAAIAAADASRRPGIW